MQRSMESGFAVRPERAIRCPGLNANQLVVVLVVLVNIRREQSTRSVGIVLFWSPGALVAPWCEWERGCCVLSDPIKWTHPPPSYQGRAHRGWPLVSPFYTRRSTCAVRIMVALCRSIIYDDECDRWLGLVIQLLPFERTILASFE